MEHLYPVGDLILLIQATGACVALFVICIGLMVYLHRENIKRFDMIVRMMHKDDE